MELRPGFIEVVQQIADDRRRRRRRDRALSCGWILFDLTVTITITVIDNNERRRRRDERESAPLDPIVSRENGWRGTSSGGGIGGRRRLRGSREGKGIFVIMMGSVEVGD